MIYDNTMMSPRLCAACQDRPAVLNGLCPACFYRHEEDRRERVRNRLTYVLIAVIYAAFLAALIYFI